MIIGVIGNGNLGKALLKHSGNYRLLECDLLNEQEVRKKIDEIKPDVIINCGAKTDITWCENHTVEAYAVNTFAVETLAKVFHGKIIHISCDEIFSGNGFGNYDEESKDFLTLNTYSSSKYFSEVGLKESLCKNYLIVRTSTLFQENTPLIKLVLDRIKTGYPISGASTVYRSYTYIPHLAKMLDVAVTMGVTGILNLASSQVINEEKFIQTLSNQMGFDKFYETGRTLLDIDYRFPKHCGLNISKAKSLGIPVFSYTDGLLEMQKER